MSGPRSAHTTIRFHGLLFCNVPGTFCLLRTSLYPFPVVWLKSQGFRFPILQHTSCSYVTLCGQDFSSSSWDCSFFCQKVGFLELLSSLLWLLWYCLGVKGERNKTQPRGFPPLSLIRENPLSCSLRPEIEGLSWNFFFVHLVCSYSFWVQARRCWTNLSGVWRYCEFWLLFSVHLIPSPWIHLSIVVSCIPWERQKSVLISSWPTY